MRFEPSKQRVKHVVFILLQVPSNDDVSIISVHEQKKNAASKDLRQLRPYGEIRSTLTSD